MPRRFYLWRVTLSSIAIWRSTTFLSCSHASPLAAEARSFWFLLLDPGAGKLAEAHVCGTCALTVWILLCLRLTFVSMLFLLIVLMIELCVVHVGSAGSLAKSLKHLKI